MNVLSDEFAHGVAKVNVWWRVNTWDFCKKLRGFFLVKKKQEKILILFLNSSMPSGDCIAFLYGVVMEYGKMKDFMKKKSFNYILKALKLPPSACTPIVLVA